MANISTFPTKDLQYGKPTSTGIFTLMKAIHPKGFVSLQLPPATLAFDVEDTGSRFAPKLKLKVTNDELLASCAAWTRRRWWR